jgi:hypothetical protein
MARAQSLPQWLPDEPQAPDLVDSPAPPGLGWDSGLPRHGGRHRGGRRRWLRRRLAVLVVVVLAVAVAGVVVSRGRPAPRLVVFGDSLVVAAQDYVRTDAAKEGAGTVSLRIWSGTAPCNWVDQVPTAIRDSHPTIAVIAFVGNDPPCMAGRSLLPAYSQDVSVMVEDLLAAGAQVRLVVAPARRTDSVDAAGLTPLGQLWELIASHEPNTRVVRADLAVTDHGQFAATLPCEASDPCPPNGQIAVRSPDGVHFCPDSTTEPGGFPCPVYASGARRYGEAIVRGALE